MKQSEVKIGAVYVMKVSGKLAHVRILSEGISYKGRRFWTGRNEKTGREIHVKSAQKLRSEFC